MINLASVSSILGILIPILVAYISTRHNFRKHPREEFSGDIDAAKEFVKILKSKDSQLIKDRITQKLVLNKNINFIEASFFYQYLDMGLWLERYINVREFLVPVFEGKNIKEFIEKYTWLKTSLFLFFYILFAFLAMTPFLFFKTYSELWSQSIENKQFLLNVNLVLWPLIFASLALIYLYRWNKASDARNFLKKFKAESFPLEKG
ncbi:hypothetical protein [Acinetobacter venetianus]|uniref:hypothetical protein n=1 Tax=Acinetobacter venetianus TaxID=52133 RepID=UPI00241C8145|nr:hypothetical protein [Acinetobacter venetianus]